MPITISDNTLITALPFLQKFLGGQDQSAASDQSGAMGPSDSGDAPVDPRSFDAGANPQAASAPMPSFLRRAMPQQNMEGQPFNGNEVPQQATATPGYTAPPTQQAPTDKNAQPVQTKGNRLLQILRAGIQGGIAGQEANAQTYAATGRNGGFGVGLGAGFQAPQQYALRAATLASLMQKPALENRDLQAQIDERNAQTQNLQHPQKANAGKPVFDKSGNIVGFYDTSGNPIGPNNTKFTSDMKDMMDAAQQRTDKPTTPEGQVMKYMVDNGSTPAEAYQFIQDSKQNSKPDTATQNKKEFQGIIAKLSQEGGNALDPSAFTDPRKLATAIQQSKTLTADEKNSAQSYLAANTTPANQILIGDQRGSSYGATRQYPVLDTKNGNRPGYVNADELNRANREEPGRYLASGPGVQALNKENLMEDIRGGIQQVRDALNNPNMPDFTAKQKVKIAVAMRERDPRSAVSSLITAGDLGTVTPEQEDYLIAHSILAEQAMAMRTVLGAGQGSQDLRAAITNTFPGPTTPSKAYGLKQLDAFEKTVDRLERGIPNVPLKDMRNGGNQGGSNNQPPPQGMINVQIPGHPPGHIPASQQKQFLQDNPGAQVLP